MSRHAWISAIVFSAIMWGLIFCAASCNAEEWTATALLTTAIFTCIIQLTKEELCLTVLYVGSKLKKKTGIENQNVAVNVAI